MRSLGIAIPAKAEFDELPACIRKLNASILSSGKGKNVRVAVVLNQGLNDTKATYDNNLATCEFLRAYQSEFIGHLYIIDAFNQPIEKGGVGAARARAVEALLPHLRQDDDIIASLDADTWVDENYIHHIFQLPKSRLAAYTFNFSHRENEHSSAMAFYELYLHYFSTGLAFALSPFAYISIGSALACTRALYEISRGFPQKDATEDFHFLNKLRKLAPVVYRSEIKVYPSSRASQRVYLGTGYFIQASTHDPENAARGLFIPKVVDFIRLKTFNLCIKNYFHDRTMLTAQSNEEMMFFKQIEAKLNLLCQNVRSKTQYDKRLPQIFDAIATYRYLKLLSEKSTSVDLRSETRVLLSHMTEQDEQRQLESKLHVCGDPTRTENV